MASSLISKMGKTPVVTPCCSNVGWKLVAAHWTLVVDVAMATGVKQDYIDDVFKRGGFFEGPFTTMKKVHLLKL